MTYDLVPSFFSTYNKHTKSQIAFPHISKLVHTENFSSGTTFTNMLIHVAITTFLFSLGSSHMVMTQPQPFGVGLDNGPLFNKPDGTFKGTTDFPCKQRGVSTYTLAKGQAYTPMAQGSTSQMAFKGSAVHGGGSCQISITYDLAPNIRSTFKVIKSIEGGCPMRNIAGNNGDNANLVNPDKFDYKIPVDIPAGKAVLAWTWFNKVGNREMYMNCAPIEITGSAGSIKAYQALPDVFVANTEVNTCHTTEGGDLKFPNPGANVERNNPTDQLLPPTGNCAAGGTAATGSGSGSPIVPSAPSPASASPAAASHSKTVAAPVAPPAAAPSKGTGSTGGIGSAGGSRESIGGTGVTVTGAVGSAATGALSGLCNTPNMFNCIGGTSFQQCASGSWSAVQSVAAGTQCVPGQSMSITIKAIANPKFKRCMRFGREHCKRMLA